MGSMASQITSLAIVYSAVNSGGRSKKTSKLRVTGLCAGNSPGTGEFPAQMASYAKNVSIWWRHHGVNHNMCSMISMLSPIVTTYTGEGLRGEALLYQHLIPSNYIHYKVRD